MRVLVLNNAAPFIRGGAEELADQLVVRLNATSGVEAELLRVPFRSEPAERIIEEILLSQNLRLYNVDRVIGLKFPTYLIPHQHKILWLLHQFRQAYDLYESKLSYLCDCDAGERIAQLVHSADRECFLRSKAIYTNSPVTQARLRKYNGFGSDVLYPPLLDGERFVGGEYGRYFFAGGRVGPGKRQHLLVEAMRLARCSVKLIIAGPLDDERYGRQLERLIAQNNMSGRVELRFGFHSRDEIADLVNGALACAYLPIDEDSMGYVTMEAFSAGKGVITSCDSGGVLELVHDGETGLVSNPDAHSLAESLDQLGGDLSTARKVGRNAKALLESKALSWDHTIASLLDN
jgi:glycosyltransferase involved in cell wall biosynthesis